MSVRDAETMDDSSQDPEHGINKKGVAEIHHQSGIGPAGFASVGSLAYSSIFPSTAVMINWHDQGRLTKIQESVSRSNWLFCDIESS